VLRSRFAPKTGIEQKLGVSAPYLAPRLNENLLNTVTFCMTISNCNLAKLNEIELRSCLL